MGALLKKMQMWYGVTWLQAAPRKRLQRKPQNEEWGAIQRAQALGNLKPSEKEKNKHREGDKP